MEFLAAVIPAKAGIHFDPAIVLAIPQIKAETTTEWIPA